MASFTRTLEVNGKDMDVYGCLPEGRGPFAAIVVIQHAPGVDAFIRTMVERFAHAGFAAVAPDLYHRLPGGRPLERMKQLKDREIIADVNATVENLRRDPGIDGERLGITGFCMGGRIAYLMAAANRDFKAAVVFYGGNIMAAWGEGEPAPFARTAEIRCPLLFHFGEEDTNPSPDDMRRLDAELTRHGKAHEFHTYSNAGHAFMNFTNAERYRGDAENVAWPRTLEFLGRYLRPGRPH